MTTLLAVPGRLVPGRLVPGKPPGPLVAAKAFSVPSVTPSAGVAATVTATTVASSPAVALVSASAPSVT